MSTAPANSGPLKSATPWLIAPGVVWMSLFLVAPIVMIIYVSFWTQSTFSIDSTLTLASWKNFFSSEAYVGALWTTIRLWLIVLFLTFIIGYPAALYVGLLVKSKTVSTILLVLCVIPFWTSFLIRVLAWRPMLGKEGAINIILMKLGIISQPIEVLLFSELSVVIGMTQIYVVFMVGPIAFMLGRIDRNIIEAARDLGARLRADILEDHSAPEPAGCRRRRDLCQCHGAGRIRHIRRAFGPQGQSPGQRHCHAGGLAQMGDGIRGGRDPDRPSWNCCRWFPAHR